MKPTGGMQANRASVVWTFCRPDVWPFDRQWRALADVAQVGEVLEPGDRPAARSRPRSGRARDPRPARRQQGREDRLLHNAHVVVMNGDTYRHPPPAKLPPLGQRR